VRFTAGRSTRLVTARLVRGTRVYASGRRAVRAGRKGALGLRARRRIGRGRYTLVLTFLDSRGAPTVIVQRVRVR
jgi:hypothetical protein